MNKRHIRVYCFIDRQKARNKTYNWQIYLIKKQYIIYTKLIVLSLGQCFTIFMGGEKMGHGVKWIEEHLGVSRKAIRVLEEKGLMPPNEKGSYRDYTDDDIERIWRIKILQGMGYSLNEISSMVDSITNDEDIDFNSSIAEKIKQLEAEKERVEKYLGYLYAIKSSGRFPTRPKEMGTIAFEEFHEKALNEWNINNNPALKQCQEVVDKLLNTPEDELEATDLGKISVLFQELQFGVQNSDKYLAELTLNF